MGGSVKLARMRCAYTSMLRYVCGFAGLLSPLTLVSWLVGSWMMPSA
jgi:hypothetical protein